MIYNLVQKIEVAIKKHLHSGNKRASEEVLDFGDFHFTEVAQDIVSILRKLRARYTKEDLIKQLKNEAELLKRVPKAKDIYLASKAGRSASPSTFFELFGFWNNALVEAGFEVNVKSKYKESDKLLLLQQIKDEAKRLGRTPTQTDMGVASKEKRSASAPVFARLFGSFGKALKAAGFKPNRINAEKGDAIAGLKFLAWALGKTPTEYDVRNACGEGRICSPNALRRLFGSYNEALKIAGLEFNLVHRPERDILIEQLQIEAKRLGWTPSAVDVKAACKEKRMASPKVFVRTFGSWDEALEAAGLEKLTPAEHRLLHKDHLLPRVMPNAEGSEIKLPSLSLRFKEDESGLKKFSFKGIENYPLLTAEQEQWLGQKIEQGDERARILFAQSNYRLVLSIVKQHEVHVSDESSFTVEDLFQEGIIGLMQAIEKFNWRMGFKFSTYATWWIMQAVRRSLADKNRTIRVPVHALELYSKYQKTVNKLSKQLERKPTKTELAAEMEIDVDTVGVMEEVLLSDNLISFDLEINDEEGGNTLADVIPDYFTDSPDTLLEKEQLKDAVKKALLTINFSLKEKLVAEMRFGLFDGIEYTLEEIGSIFGLTTERIRQIESKVEEKLRGSSGLKKLSAD